MSWRLATLSVLGVVACGVAPSAEPIDECLEEPCGEASSDEPTTTGAGTASTGGDDDDEPPPMGGDLPCDVRDVLAAECWLCHGAAPAFGAPMSLTSLDDFLLPAASDPARSVSELVAERLVDELRPMPQGGEISDADRDVLLDFVAAGTPADPDADCGPAPEPDAPEAGPDALDCEPDIILAAHAPGSSEPFEVPVVDDLYRCFAFPVPDVPSGQAIARAPIIDDERVIHHWILYRQTEQPEADVYDCGLLLQLSADFVAGWAPGGENVTMPDDVGLELGNPGDWFVLQVHYNNSAGHMDARDQSGVAFCSAESARPKTAGVLTLGTISINIPPGAEGYQTTGTCNGAETGAWPEPFHVLGASPHMHQLGRSLTTALIREGGDSELLTHVPNFVFESQKIYFNDPEVIIQPGDTLNTTCGFDNPNAAAVGFGEATTDEMCFNFVLGYPIQSLPDRNCGISFL